MSNVVSSPRTIIDAQGFVENSANLNDISKLAIRRNVMRRPKDFVSANGAGFVRGVDSIRMTLNRTSAISSARLNVAIYTKSFDEEIAALSPGARWIFLAKSHTKDFLFYVVAIFVCVYLLMLSFSPIIHFTLRFVSSNANAVEMNATPVDMNYGPYLLFMMASILAWSLGALTFSKTPKQLEIARDTMKTILAVVLGFFSGAGAVKGR